MIILGIDSTKKLGIFIVEMTLSLILSGGGNTNRELEC